MGLFYIFNSKTIILNYKRGYTVRISNRQKGVGFFIKSTRKKVYIV